MLSVEVKVKKPVWNSTFLCQMPGQNWHMGFPDILPALCVPWRRKRSTTDPTDSRVGSQFSKARQAYNHSCQPFWPEADTHTWVLCLLIPRNAYSSTCKGRVLTNYRWEKKFNYLSDVTGYPSHRQWLCHSSWGFQSAAQKYTQNTQWCVYGGQRDLHR